jgi:hypothetical protein
MIFARWVGTSKIDNNSGHTIVEEDDIIEVYARGAKRTEFVCRNSRHAKYFWGSEMDLEWCTNMKAEDVVHDFNNSSHHYSHFK